jgi:1-acyl-sn-glycerol-3-phosphate acyltransferase
MSASLALSLHNVYETLAISFPTVLEALGGRVTKEVCDDRLESWARLVVEHAAIDLDVSGGERRKPGETYLVMSNHQSLYDIPVLFHVIGSNLRMVAKKELFGLPVFGGALAAAGFIRIDRRDRSSAFESLRHGHALLTKGTHVWIAPEGTRSHTGKLLPFKKGAFYLAFDAGMPILPVTLSGTQDVLPAHGLRSRTGAKVRVTIHDPIDPRPFSSRGKEGRQELMDRVRREIESAL